MLRSIRDDAAEIFPDVRGLWRTLASALGVEPFGRAITWAEEPHELVRALLAFLDG